MMPQNMEAGIVTHILHMGLTCLGKSWADLASSLLGLKTHAVSTALCYFHEEPIAVLLLLDEWFFHFFF